MNNEKRVLFVDDDSELVEVLARQARSMSLKVFTARNALTALQVIEREALDLICLDVEMPTGDGLSIGEMMAAKFGDVPVVVLTGLKDEETRQRCANLGTHYLAKGNDTWPRLKALLTELLDLECDSRDRDSRDRDSSNGDNDNSESITDLVFAMLGALESALESPDSNEQTAKETDPAANPWILCVEDDRDFSLALQLRLQSHDINVVRAFDGVEGIQTALTRPAEAVILDYNLPNGRGDYVLRRLKANPLTRDIPVIVVSGQKRPGLEKEMLHLGAVRFFAKPVRFEELLEELQQQITLAI